MAGGENPRKTKKERIKNRYFHKFKYLKEKYKIFGCVGCGRCIIKCPVNIDITRVVKQLGNYE
jgi:heterodisulfide reductase subunit C